MTASRFRSNKTAKIGVIAPLSGDLAALGLGIKNSVDLAIKQANENKTIPGWTLELAAEDDQAKPDVGKNAATKLASDKDVVGVVGTLNSSVAQSVQPVLRLRPRSSRSRRPTPTRRSPRAPTSRPPRSAPTRTYFRTCTTDSIQGPFAARYLFEKAGIKKVATVHDKKTYGQGLVDAFTDGVQEARRQDRRGRDDQPRRRQVRRRHQQDQAARTRRPSTTAASTRRPVRSRSR